MRGGDGRVGGGVLVSRVLSSIAIMVEFMRSKGGWDSKLRLWSRHFDGARSEESKVSLQLQGGIFQKG